MRSVTMLVPSQRTSHTWSELCKAQDTHVKLQWSNAEKAAAGFPLRDTMFRIFWVEFLLYDFKSNFTSIYPEYKLLDMERISPGGQ